MEETTCDEDEDSSSDDEAEEVKPSTPPYTDLHSLPLKENHMERPLWVTPKGVIYVERRSKFYPQAYEFLSTIGEPISRSECIQEWKLTRNSLHSASSVELTPEGILDELEKLSKMPVSASLREFVRRCADSYGKVKLVLVKGRFFVESSRVDLLRKLLANKKISGARVASVSEESTSTLEEAIAHVEGDLPVLELEDEEEGDRAMANRRRFEIASSQVEGVKNAALSLDLPLMEEFDYKQDVSTSSIEATLKVGTEIRPYQAKCLSKMFSHSLAKSGLCVLPCGSGKTLTAIAAVCTMKKSAVVVCSNTIAVEQFKRQFHQFADIRHVCRFTSKAKDAIPEDGGFVLLTTYSMLAVKRNVVLDVVLQQEFGLLVLDEVHVAPAKLFRQILGKVKSHCKLGLTATMVREDELIADLSFLIGPKLYEADWQTLTEQGFLARVLCQEVRCSLSSEFAAEYFRCPRNSSLSRQLVALNPNKFLACEYLLKLHEARGDKVLVFCDSILTIEYFASTMNRDMIHGGTPERRRMELLGMFRFSSAVNSLFISKVGDMAIDLPEANVILQISSHFGSRRQEAQRMGRILRPKPHSDPSSFNAFFYSLVVPDTHEQFYANRRQRYLVDQGYSFRVIDDILSRVALSGQRTSGALSSVQDQRALLAKLLVASDAHAAVPMPVAHAPPALPASKRLKRASLAAVSANAGSTVYAEFERKG